MPSPIPPLSNRPCSQRQPELLCGGDSKVAPQDSGPLTRLAVGLACEGVVCGESVSADERLLRSGLGLAASDDVERPADDEQ
jgi:hypothetical protein